MIDQCSLPIYTYLIPIHDLLISRHYDFWLLPLFPLYNLHNLPLVQIWMPPVCPTFEIIY